MPTGCRIHSVNDWLRNQHQGRHYETGDILAFASAPESFDYIAADITAAYDSTRFAEPGNSPKVSSVVRKFAYLREPCAVVVFDRVVTTDPSYPTRWLLHTPGRPETQDERRIAGESSDDGIFSTDDRWLRMSFEQGRLFHQVLLPGDARILKIGGPSYRGYVNYDDVGESLALASQRRDEPDRCGLWRTEVIANTSEREHLFLNVVWPRLASDEAPQQAQLLSAGPALYSLAVADWVVVLAGSGEFDAPISYDAPAGVAHHLVVDLAARSGWRVENGDRSQVLFASEDGVLNFDAGAGPTRLTPVSPRGGEGHQ